MDFLKKYYPFIVSLLVLLIYLFTLAPTVMQIDTGELATVQATLGIAHPTGYPLFTLLGYLFLNIPLPFSKIYQTNLLASIYCSAALFLFMKTIITLFNFTLFQSSIHSKNKKNKKKIVTGKPISIPVGFELIFLVIITALTIAFNSTFWQQSTSTEVYSLQGLLFTLILFSAAKFFTKEDIELKDYLFLSCSVALGFTNHMTTLLLIPGLTYLFFAKTGFSKTVFKKILLMLVVFFCIVAVGYAYLFIRSAQNPSLNWGNPFNFENFLRHVSGKQYQVWMFSSLDDAKKQLVGYISGLPSVFAYFPLIFSVVGIVFLFRLNKKLFIFFIITYLFSVLYTINYSIHDIESYYLLSYMILTIFAGFGFLKTFIWIKNKYDLAFINYSTFSLLIVFIFTLNFGKADSSGIYVYEDYTKTILNSVPQNSIIFSYQWDYFVASSYYFRIVDGFRKDVVVIDKELLRRSWYYNQLTTNYPEVIKNIKPEINSFLEALKPFEQNRAFDSNTLELYYQAIMTKLISGNIGSRDYFIGPEVFEVEMQSGQFRLPNSTSLVPFGLLFKVTNGNDYVPGPPMNFKIRFPKERDSYSAFIYNQTGTMLLRRAIYELKFEMKGNAREIIEKIRRDLPEFIISEQVLQKIQ